MEYFLTQLLNRNNYIKLSNKEVIDSITDKLNQIESHIFSKLKTNDAKTQESEKKTKKIIEDILNKLDLLYEEASPHSTPDYKLWDYGIGIELKKTDTKTIMLNDSYPNPDYIYIFICTSINKIIVKKGSDLIKLDKKSNDNKLLKKVLRYLDTRDSFITTYIRPNYQLHLQYILQPP